MSSCSLREPIRRVLASASDRSAFAGLYTRLENLAGILPDEGYFITDALNSQALGIQAIVKSPAQNTVPLRDFKEGLDWVLFTTRFENRKATVFRRFSPKQLSQKIDVDIATAKKLLDYWSVSGSHLEAIVGEDIEQEFYRISSLQRRFGISEHILRDIASSGTIDAYNFGVVKSLWRIPGRMLPFLEMACDSSNVYTVHRASRKLGVHYLVARRVLSKELEAGNVKMFKWHSQNRYYIPPEALKAIAEKLSLRATISFNNGSWLNSSDIYKEYKTNRTTLALWRAYGLKAVNLDPYLDRPFYAYKKQDADEFVAENILHTSGTPRLVPKQQRIRLLMHYIGALSRKRGDAINYVMRMASTSGFIVRAVLERHYHEGDGLLEAARARLKSVQESRDAAEAGDRLLDIARKNLKSIVEEIAFAPVLSDSEQRELIQKGRQGDESALHKLVLHGMRLAVHVAKNVRQEYSSYKLDMGDLLSAGKIALYNAADRFDLEREGCFSTYASVVLKNSMVRELIEPHFIGALRFKDRRLVSKMYDASERLAQLLGRQPSRREIANAVHATEARLIAIEKKALMPMSFGCSKDDDDDGNNSLEPASHEASPEYASDSAALRARLIKALKEILDYRERRVVCLSYGIGEERPYTLDEIGRKYGCTYQNISLIKEAAMRKLRRQKGLAQMFMEAV